MGIGRGMGAGMQARSQWGWARGAGASLLLAAVLGSIGCTPLTVPAGQTGGSFDSSNSTDGSDAASPGSLATEAPAAGTQAFATVARVIDGDTLDLSTGERVRLIGIDTPERGDCGYAEAAALLTELVAGREVSVTNPAEVEDTDAYGRLLAYLGVPGVPGATVDVGHELVARGLAVPRYNSTDGYALHPFEADYAAAAATATPFTCGTPGGVPAAGQWSCVFDPTYDQNWHNDAWCTNGAEGHRPALREWDSHVTESELMESAAEYARALNGG
ncbi:thermonuclease family protein [Leucobacter sp. W1038]|uniref:thermonuclease family protein n=1 Tax=Leucobacter sp. W1038 TaxID=3438281 RepID=UPI003D958856